MCISMLPIKRKRITGFGNALFIVAVSILLVLQGIEGLSLLDSLGDSSTDYLPDGEKEKIVDRIINQAPEAAVK